MPDSVRDVQEPEARSETSDRVYRNSGNSSVVALVDRDSTVVLDVGCGSGDTAALLRARDPHKRIYGITQSRQEANVASQHLEACWVQDLEAGLPDDLLARQYDTLILSHVLEHLRNPQLVLARLSAPLRSGGTCVIAVPNVLVWRQRWQFLRGRFEYQASGTMDETHLRFYTYDTAARYLLAATPRLRLIERHVTGSVPLWFLRRHLFPMDITARIDALGCAQWPNLFGGEVLLKCQKE